MTWCYRCQEYVPEGMERNCMPNSPCGPRSRRGSVLVVLNPRAFVKLEGARR